MADLLMPKVPCRFAEGGCQSPARAVYYVPQGCWCWPDPVQALCPQHALSVESTGPIELIASLEGATE